MDKEELMNSLKIHEGWEMVEQYINKQIQFHEQQLLSCSLDKVEKHRNKRETLKLVLSYVNGD